MSDPQPKPHILVVDDDNRLRDLLREYLRDQEFAVTVATSAKDARQKLALFLFDLLVLDVMMPGETGVEFARTLGKTAPPILLLTAMAAPDDRISGLEAGADDYLVKPFEPRELVLRIQAILRRTAAAGGHRAQVRFGDYEFDLSAVRLQKGGEVFVLTTSEGQLLKVLAERADEPVARAELAQCLGTNTSERSVDVQVTRLRKKIEADSSRPLYIQTVRGAGYVLHVDREQP